MLQPTAITLDNFQDIIITQSQEKLVMIQFWMPGNQACQQMTDVLMQVAANHTDNMLYAQVNCESEQQIAAQFGIQSLPTVILVKGGQPVDGFAGLSDASQVESLLSKHLPKPEAVHLQAAQVAMQNENWDEALLSLQQATVIAPENDDITFALVQCYIATQQIAAAENILTQMSLLQQQDSRYALFMGQVELAKQAAESPAIKALQAQLAAEPENLQVKVELAVQLNAAHQPEEALSLLLAVLRSDLNFGDAKKICIDIINGLADGDPLKATYRRQLYSLLY